MGGGLSGAAGPSLGRDDLDADVDPQCLTHSVQIRIPASGVDRHHRCEGPLTCVRTVLDHVRDRDPLAGRHIGIVTPGATRQKKSRTTASGRVRPSPSSAAARPIGWRTRRSPRCWPTGSRSTATTAAVGVRAAAPRPAPLRGSARTWAPSSRPPAVLPQRSAPRVAPSSPWKPPAVASPCRPWSCGSRHTSSTTPARRPRPVWPTRSPSSWRPVATGMPSSCSSPAPSTCPPRPSRSCARSPSGKVWRRKRPRWCTT
jgi:hypothetical protein